MKVYAWLSGLCLGFFFSLLIWHQNWTLIVISLILSIFFGTLTKIKK